MTNDSENGKRRYLRLSSAQQRRQDDQIANLRMFYESLDDAQRLRLKEWLNLADELERRGSGLETHLYVRVQHDELDKNEELVDWRDARFPPCTILDAIRAWDAGEDFTPSTLLPH